MPHSDVVTATNILSPKELPASNNAIEAIRAANEDNLIIVDLDETLFLRNSTEEYLDAIYPRPAGALLLLGLKALKPWRLLPSRMRHDDMSKDWCLVVAATLLFPWTLLVWRSRAKSLAKRFWNQHLVQAMNANPNAEVVVATLGFDVIVNPLLKHLPVVLSKTVGPRNVIACHFWRGAADRAKGKLAMVREQLGHAALERAIVITDSTRDQPLLDAVETPCLVVWPDAEWKPAMADVYMPLFYSEKVKNPNKSHFLKRVLMGHWAFLAISLSFLSPHPLLNAFSLLLLVISYWCVYEIGYQENDSVGEKYEKKPILSENYARYKSRIDLNTAAPWYWAAAIALPALMMIEIGKIDGSLSLAFETVLAQGPALLIFDMAVWIWFLIAVRLTFWMYNQFNEEARIWIYPLLQVQKLFGFTLLVGINTVGAALLMSLIIARWLHYAIYRCGGDRWRFPLNLSCLLLFLMMYVSLAAGSSSISEVLTLQSAVALAYCSLRSIKPIKELKNRVRLVGQAPLQVSEPQHTGSQPTGSLHKQRQTDQAPAAASHTSPNLAEVSSQAASQSCSQTAAQSRSTKLSFYQQPSRPQSAYSQSLAHSVTNSQSVSSQTGR